MTGYTKPLPSPDRDTQEFWEGCRRHELRLQRCADCGLYTFPPLPMCPGCNSMNRQWAKVSGKGKVYSWFVVHRATHPDFVADVPYAVVVVTPDEQDDIHIAGNIVGCAAQDIRVDMPVEVVFDEVTAEVTLPKWRPVARSGQHA